ncbi:hypothetical protein I3217_02040 [Formosa sp. S-31]
MNYILIVIGIIVAMFAKIDPNQNKYILIIGICVLMFGIFRLSQSIPSKKNREDEFNDAEHE